MRRVAQSAAMGTRLTAMDAPATGGAGEAARGCCGAVSGWWKGVFRFYLNLSSRFELIRNRLFSSRSSLYLNDGASPLAPNADTGHKALCPVSMRLWLAAALARSAGGPCCSAVSQTVPSLLTWLEARLAAAGRAQWTREHAVAMVRELEDKFMDARGQIQGAAGHTQVGSLPSAAGVRHLARTSGSQSTRC